MWQVYSMSPIFVLPMNSSKYLLYKQNIYDKEYTSTIHLKCAL